MARHDEATKAKALTLAATMSLQEIADALGVPKTTVWRWVNGTERKTERNGTERPSKKLEALGAQAVERAIEEAGDYIATRLKGLADKLYSLADKAANKVDVAISDPDELPGHKHGESHDRDGAAWVRALVGVMAQSIDKAQLLSGKPTARPEVMERHEYDITTRVISERPELLDVIFTQAEQPSMADRSGPGARPRLGELR